MDASEYTDTETDSEEMAESGIYGEERLSSHGKRDATRWDHYAQNNIANSAIKWGLRISRTCLKSGGAGCADVGIALIVDVGTSFDREPQP